MKRRVVSFIMGIVLSVAMVVPCMADEVEAIAEEISIEEEVVLEESTLLEDDVDEELVVEEISYVIQHKRYRITYILLSGIFLSTICICKFSYPVATFLQ